LLVVVFYLIPFIPFSNRTRFKANKGGVGEGSLVRRGLAPPSMETPFYEPEYTNKPIVNTPYANETLSKRKMKDEAGEFITPL